MKKLMNSALGLSLAATCATSALSGELTIATVGNGQIIDMQLLAPVFLEDNPDISINWVTLDEGALRERATEDIQTTGRQFDIITIGTYEAPIWGDRGWIQPLYVSEEYDLDDILPAMRSGLSVGTTLYAAPFYGESSMTMYRSDLLGAAGIRLADNPTYAEIEEAAAAITDRDAGLYGICLRGKPGWGENVAFVTTMANSFGAQIFDENWVPTLDSPEWNEAVTKYIELLTNYGPPNPTAYSHGENLQLMRDGRCGIWIDATSLAAAAINPDETEFSNDITFTQAPYAVTDKGANWLWSWALAIPTSSNQRDDAQRFIEWATSKEYIALVGETRGWANVPAGTRESTYQNPNFQREARFADAELAAIQSANPNDSTANPSPYTGVQFASIPEFADIGTVLGDQLAAALSGEISVEEALETAQAYAYETMQQAGYF